MKEDMILVTGSTGFVGQEVVKQFVDAGYPVRVLARNVENAKEVFKNTQVEIVNGDVLDPSSLRKACKEVQAVVHLVGIISEIGNATYEKIHVEGTRNVIAAAKKATVARFLHMSAIGTREHSASKYHQTKWQAEALVKNSPLNWTIFRPSLIYGKKDSFTTLFSSFLDFPWNVLMGYALPCFGDGENVFQPVGVEEVAKAFVTSLASEKAYEKVYDVVGPNIEYRELLTEIGKARGKKPVYLDCAPVAQPAVGLLQLLSGKNTLIVPLAIPLCKALAFFLKASGAASLHELALKWEFPLPKLILSQDQITMLEESQFGDSSALKDDLGIEARPFAEGVSAYLY